MEFNNNQHLSFLVKQQYTGDDGDDYDVYKNDFNIFFSTICLINFGQQRARKKKTLTYFKYGNNKAYLSFYGSLNDTLMDLSFFF